MPVLIVAAAAAAMSQAAADECLPAPMGAAAKGQHWYYHLDRTTHQKCWHLRGAADAAEPQNTASTAAPPPAETASRPAPAPATPPAAAPSAPAPDNAPAMSAPPETPAAPQSTGSVWADPPAPPATATDAPTASPAPAAEPQPPAPPIQPAPAAAAEPTPSLAQNLWIVALAAAFAAFTFAAFALVRARRAVKPTPAPAAPAGPRFGSGGVRRASARWPIEKRGEAPELPAIEASLIPEQVPMPLPPLDTRR
jgi:hypothetical protein